MSQLDVFLLLLALHWVADFVCQSDEVARSKSRDNGALTTHVFVYSWVMVAGLALFAVVYYMATARELTQYYTTIWFALFVPHWCTDYVTSKMTAHYYTTGQRHNFFVTIGFDQLVHAVCIYVTVRFFF